MAIRFVTTSAHSASGNHRFALIDADPGYRRADSRRADRDGQWARLRHLLGWRADARRANTRRAALCFVIARRFGRGIVERFAGDVNNGKAGRWIAQWGAAGIVATELIPGFSFDLISYGAGLTAMPFRRFIIATFVGSAPQAFLSSYLMQESPMLAWGMVGVSVVIFGALALYSLIQRHKVAQVPA